MKLKRIKKQIKMKKPILTLIVVCGLFFGGCKKTLEEKAHRLIHKYINENVDDISSYEEISTSPIDSLFTNYGLQPEITEYLREAKKQSDEIKILTALSEAVKPFAYFHRPSAIELGDYGRKIKQHAEILGAYNDSIQIFNCVSPLISVMSTDKS